MAAPAHARRTAPEVRPPAQAARAAARVAEPDHHDAPPPGGGSGERATHLRIVETRPRWRLRTGPTIALSAVLFFAIAFAVVAFQATLVEGQARLDDLSRQTSEALDRQAELRLQVGELEAPERITAAARRLGMVPPPGVTYLTPSGVVTTPGGTEAGAPAEVDAPAEGAAEDPAA